MATFIARFDLLGDSADDTLVANYFGPFPGSTTDTYVFKLDGEAGDDRLTFNLADFVPSKGTVYGNINGATGTDTLELDFAGATSVTSGVSGGVVRYDFQQQDSTHAVKGALSADSTVERIIIKGSDFNDVFHGLAGDDWFDGRGGVDTFYGSAGDDGYVFSEAGDVVVGEVAGGGIDSIFSTITVNLSQQAFVENVRLSGTANINATGSSAANLLTGNAASNVITGGLGVDSLYGKGGADTFAFSEYGAANKDSIWDFSSDDRINLSSSVFIGLSSELDGSLSASQFKSSVSGSGAQIIYKASTGVLSYDADGAGGAVAQDIAFVGKNLAFFNAHDIFLV